MIDKIETPREFYTNVVVVDILEFRNKPDDLRLAYHACISLLSLRDWIFTQYAEASWQWMSKQQSTFASKKVFQGQLENIHDEFRIITDAANAYKHLILDKGRRRTRAEGVANVHIRSVTTCAGGALLGSMGLNTTMLNEAPDVVTQDSVVIDDGGKLYDVKTSVESTNEVWLGLMTENNW